MDNSKILKGIVETLVSIVDEAQFIVTPKEFVINAMDSGRICMLRVSIKKNCFSEYSCASISKVDINLNDLDKILKRSTSVNSVGVEFSHKEQRIKVRLKKEGTSLTRTFRLAAIQAEAKEIPIDVLQKIEYSSKWGINPELLIEAIKDGELYSDTLTIKIEKGKLLTFSSIGPLGEMTCELEVSELTDHTIEGKNVGMYSLGFLKAILKIAPITEALEMALTTDNPLRLLANLIGGGELSYFLADKVEESEVKEAEEIYSEVE